MGLRQKINEFFTWAESACVPHPELTTLRAVLQARRSAVDQPMRVAIVGATNAGKSTLVNAFLGENRAAVANGEMTQLVTWFKYGDTRRLVIRWVDREPTEEAFEELVRLTTPGGIPSALAASIQCVEVYCPLPILRYFDLLDTPGLHSFYESESRHTAILLHSEHARPHAMVYVYSNTVTEHAVKDLERFQKACGSLASGITAIGVKSKIDENPREPNPIGQGQRAIDSLQASHPQTRLYFYTILPVAGLVAVGAQSLNAEQLEALQVLATLPEATRILLRALPGAALPPDMPAPEQAVRVRLGEVLGKYGLWLAMERLRENPGCDIVAELLQASNFGRLREIVIAHFGNRAFLIKARSALSFVRDQAYAVAWREMGDARIVAHQIAGRIDRISLDEIRFREFDLLERRYSDRLPIEKAEIEELLRVSGEHGTDCRARLGMPPETPAPELHARARARERYWRATGNMNTSSGLSKVAHVLADSYDMLAATIAAAIAEPVRAEEILQYEL